MIHIKLCPAPKCDLCKPNNNFPTANKKHFAFNELSNSLCSRERKIKVGEQFQFAGKVCVKDSFRAANWVAPQKSDYARPPAGNLLCEIAQVLIIRPPLRHESLQRRLVRFEAPESIKLAYAHV